MVEMTRQEQDNRLNILNSLLTTPHRKLDQVYPLHAQMIAQDPLFYGRLGAWYNDTGDIRDHKECFVVNMCLSDFEGHRDAGCAMLREMPPYQVLRVIDFIHGKKNKKTTKGAGNAPAQTVVENFGLGKNVPRSVKTEVARYLKEREADGDWFDSSVMVARKAMKRLYALLHITPSERAQAILFEDKPPEDSKLFAIKELVKATTPQEQAKVIMEHKVPYRIASTVVSAMTPTVLLALIDVMSSQELINNLSALRKRGAMDNPDLKALIEKKLEKAKTDKRVSALKATEAVKVAGLSEDINKQLEDVADSQVKARGRINRPTALLIDKSGSMSQAIELGKQIGSMLSAIMDADLFVYAFDTMAYPIKAQGEDLAAWEKALKGIQAGGGTSCGVPLEYMIRAKQRVENIILISDEGENQTPLFVPTLQKYMGAMNVTPSVCMVKTVNAENKLERAMQAAGLQCDAWQFSGGTDYYSLTNLIPFLTKPSRLDLLMDIMMYEMPQRKAS